MKAAMLIVCGILVLAVAGLWLDRDRNTELLEDARRRVAQYEHLDSMASALSDSARAGMAAADRWRAIADSVARTNNVTLIVHEELHAVRSIGVDSLRAGLLAAPE